jgi:peptidoglycan-associated lipoprotein
MAFFGPMRVAAMMSGICAAFGLLGCGGATPAAHTAGVEPPATAARPAEAAATEAATTSSVHISDDIRSQCSIPDVDAYFAFDSARLTASDRTPLDLVVQCFTSGPLRGRSVKLIGRADPRGQPEYNITLGQWRADAVGTYLTSRGMRRDQTSPTSRGAMDATGTNETTWQHDRRVDVMLGD